MGNSNGGGVRLGGGWVQGRSFVYDGCSVLVVLYGW